MKEHHQESLTFIPVIKYCSLKSWDKNTSWERKRL